MSSPIALPQLSAAAKRDIGAPTNPDAHIPALFQPTTSRGLKLKNRVLVSPMCQYSATDGVPNGWHLAHLTGFASRGAAVVCAEATAVQANGRISPEDTGIWNDEQASAWKAIAGLIASQGAVPAIQLAHAGRKASSLSPFNAAGQHTVAATKEQGGWPDNVYGPTSEAYSETAAVPKEMSAQEIDGLIEDFAKAAERADRAGFGVIEIHGAHGYLIHSFLSPLTNTRTDTYGTDRTLFLLRILRAIRAIWPEEKPIWVRLSCTDYMEHSGEKSWTVEDSVELCKVMKKEGLADLIDCSGGGLVSGQKIPLKPGYQVPFASAIHAALSSAPGPHPTLVAAVGLITDGQQASAIVSEGKADAVFVAREFLRDAGTVLRWARELGVDVGWAVQYERAKVPVAAK